MVMLFFIQDLGSSLMFYGGFLARALRGDQPLLVRGHRPRRSSPAGAWVLYHARPTITHRVDAWLHPSASLYDQVGGSYQIAQSVFAQADGGLFGRGFGQALLKVGDSPLLPAAQTDLIYSVIVNELGLIGACAVLLHLPAGRRARLQDRHARARLVLQAAGHRADRGLRAAGLRHRRRRHARHPADRRDAALHLLRRLVDPGQLRAARAAAADLRPRAPRGGRAAMNAPIARLFVVVVRALRGARRLHLALDRVRRQCAARQPEEPPRAARGAEDPPRADPRRRRHACWPARSSSPTTATCAPIRPGRLFSHAVGYSFVRQGRAGLERFYDDDLSGRSRASSARSSTACRAPSRTGDNLRHLAGPGRAARRAAAARRAQGRRRRAGPAHGRDQGHGLGPRL